MTTHVHARVHAVCLAALLGFVTVGLPAESFAQSTTESHIAKRLGGATRFTTPVRNIQNLQKTFARPRTQRDITALLKLAGLESLEADVKKAIADGAVREVTISPGTRLEWMAMRERGRAHMHRNVTWGGKKPFPGFEFVIDNLVHFSFRNEADMRAVTAAFTRLVWFCADQGLPLDIEAVLDPAQVEAYLRTVLPERVARNRYLFRRLGLALTKVAPWTPHDRRGSHPGPTTVEPYDDDEIDLLWRVAQYQSSVLRRRTATSLMVFGHGAGLRPKEILWAQVGDIEQTPAGALVHIGAPQPRIVPIRNRYRHALAQLCANREPEEFITGRDAQTYSTTALTYQLDDARLRPSEVPLIRAPRLRMTWVKDLVLAGVPIADIHAAAGRIGSRTLAHLLDQLPPSPEPTFRTNLTEH